MHESNLLQVFEIMQLEVETMKFLDMTIKDLGLTIKTTLPYKFSKYIGWQLGKVDSFESSNQKIRLK